MTMTIAGVTPEYTLTPIPSEHAMCYTDDAFPTYAYGSEACIWFVSETDEGWYVKSVKLNGTEITPDADGRYRFKVTSNIEITVETEQRVHTVTVVSGEHGTVTPASGEYIVMACVYSDVPGDMNNDGALNASDASAILKAVIGAETGANPAMADINGDGRVNALDAAAILRMMIGGL